MLTLIGSALIGSALPSPAFHSGGEVRSAVLTGERNQRGRDPWPLDHHAYVHARADRMR